MTVANQNGQDLYLNKITNVIVSAVPSTNSIITLCIPPFVPQGNKLYLYCVTDQHILATFCHS